MGNQFLSLSLFIMLLSFFIVLSAMSDFSMSRSATVMNSLAIAFSSKEIPDTLEPNLTPALEQSFRQGNALDHVEALFRSHISGVNIARNRLGTEMHMRISVTDFDNYISDPTSKFMNVLVSLLDSQSGQNGPYRMDIILNGPQPPAQMWTENRDQLDQKTTTASLYATRLEQLGLPRKLLTVGLGTGDINMIDLFVKPYTPYTLPVQQKDIPDA